MPVFLMRIFVDRSQSILVFIYWHVNKNYPAKAKNVSLQKLIGVFKQKKRSKWPLFDLRSLNKWNVAAVFFVWTCQNLEIEGLNLVSNCKNLLYPPSVHYTWL